MIQGNELIVALATAAAAAGVSASNARGGSFLRDRHDGLSGNGVPWCACEILGLPCTTTTWLFGIPLLMSSENV